MGEKRVKRKPKKRKDKKMMIENCLSDAKVTRVARGEIALKCCAFAETDLDLSLRYILTLESYSRFDGKNNFLAPGVCFPQPCSSAGRKFAASRSRLQNYQRIVSFPQQKNR